MKKLSLLLAIVLALSCLSGVALAEGDRTLKVRTLYHANLTTQAKAGEDFNENYVVEALEKASGIDLIMEPALSNSTEELQKKIMMLTAHEAPDVFVNYYNSNEYFELANQGLLRPLDEYLTEEYLGNYLQYIDMEFLDQFRVDGVLYGLPDENEQACNPTDGILVRKDLFDQLNIEVPTTIDEFYDMLVLAKQTWPDMIPFGTTGTYDILTTSFACPGQVFPNEDGTYGYKWISENFKAYVTFVNKLYNEGLIEQEYLTLNANQKYEKIINNQYFCMSSWWAGPRSQFQEVFNAIPGCEFFFIPYPLTEFGRPVAAAKVPASHIVMIPKDTPKEKADLAIEYMNFACSDYVMRISLLGVEGVNYTLKDKDVTGWNILDSIENYTPVGWKIIYDWFTTPEHFNARSVLTGAAANYDPLLELGAAAGKVDVRWEPHNLYVKSEDYADLYNMTGCYTYYLEQSRLFMTNARPLSEWDNYVQEMKDRGLDDLVVELNKWIDTLK